MNVLVTGGTGYIGAHLVRLLGEHGHSVVVADDVVTGDAGRIGDVPIVRLNLASEAAIDSLSETLRRYDIDTVVHFAARKQVGESVSRPAWYYQQNVAGLANLLLAMERTKISRFIFSSSAAVYASSDEPVTEAHPTLPISPYGETKLVGEWLTRDATIAWPLTAVSLRYFNVSGAALPELGDTAVLNLIPMAIEKLLEGEPPVIFGADYSTPDGTCVRDYIHVQDVAEAHLAGILGIDELERGHHIYNVGSGQGRSVREIMDALLAVAGSRVEPLVVERRAGDPAIVVASAERIRMNLGWSARFGLDEIVKSAWDAFPHAPAVETAH